MHCYQDLRLSCLIKNSMRMNLIRKDWKMNLISFSNKINEQNNFYDYMISGNNTVETSNKDSKSSRNSKPYLFVPPLFDKTNFTRNINLKMNEMNNKLLLMKTLKNKLSFEQGHSSLISRNESISWLLEWTEGMLNYPILTITFSYYRPKRPKITTKQKYR